MNRRLLSAAFIGLFALAALGGSGWLSGQQPKPGDKKESPAAEAAKEPAAKDPAALAAERAAALEKDVTQGALRLVGAGGAVVECPLKHTDVTADVSGFIARVKVVQTFANPAKEKIEAVYVFPLPNEAAVDDMTMVIGERKIVGQIKRRDEARHIYEVALHAGQTAALLEQERPNIFTQSVGNIEPGQEIKIEISYVDVLKYDLGTYEFHFPMVVGPRYNPGAPISSPPARPKELEGKVSPPAADTTKVPDGSKISPPVLKPGVRNGHEISLAVNLDAGVPIQNIKIANHEAEVQRPGNNKATIKLADTDSLPNKDFVLRYGVVGKEPELAMLTHTGKYTDTGRLGSGYFMLMIQPKEDERLKKSPPREMVFLVDVSGSMSGEPTKKVISAMQEMLKLCREKDTLQVITFASNAEQLFEKSVPCSEANIKRALEFSSGLKGSGGTEMLKGVKLAIDAPVDKERVRIVVMLTDGYIGNEAEIIEHVGKNCGDQVRFWAIGIGSSPNMFLIDGVAKQGGGMGKRLGLLDDPVPLTQEVVSRIQRAQLSKVQIDWGGLPIAETFPAKLPELWAGRPVIVYGRFNGAMENKTIHVKGSIEGEAADWPVTVTLPEKEPANGVLSKVWARQKIEDLMQQSYYQGSPAVEEEVTALALDYRLMSQYTSFVAVDAKDTGKTQAPVAPPRRMLVPVPLPEGTQWEGFFGGEVDEKELKDGLAVRFKVFDRASAAAGAPGFGPRGGSGFGGGWGGGGGGGFGYARGGAMPAAKGKALKKDVQKLEKMSKSIVSSRERDVRLSRSTNGKQQLNQLKRTEELSKKTHERGFFAQTWGADSRAPRQRLLALYDGEDVAERSLEGSYTAQALSPLAAEAFKSAQAALKIGERDLEKNELEQARIAFTRACFLDTAAASFGHSDGDVAAQALDALADIHERQLTERTKHQPALAKKLDLVLKDKSLAEALAEVAKAAEVEIRLLPGSAEDSAELLGSEPRVTYLDLRGATAAQALDWLLQPARLTWRLNQSAVVAASERRLSGDSTWVYDVSAIALPLAKELEGLKEPQKMLDAAKKNAVDFMAAIRKELKVKDEADLSWFGPGELLVIGNAELHTEASKLLHVLATSDFKPRGDIGALYAVTKKRAAERAEMIAKSKAAQKLAEVAEIHETFAWRLLAASAGGQLDDEALTELQIAWDRPETADLLKGRGAGIALRSLWIIDTASRELKEEKDLAALAESAHKQSQDALSRALDKTPKDDEALAAFVYAALATRKGVKAKTLLEGAVKVDAETAPAQQLAIALLGDPKSIDRAALAKLIESGVHGDDLIVLTALACRRAGGDTWNAFRAQARTLLGEQPLSGSVVVFVNRL